MSGDSRLQKVRPFRNLGWFIAALGFTIPGIMLSFLGFIFPGILWCSNFASNESITLVLAFFVGMFGVSLWTVGIFCLYAIKAED